MPQYAAFHLGLQCLMKYAFWSDSYTVKHKFHIEILLLKVFSGNLICKLAGRQGYRRKRDGFGTLGFQRWFRQKWED